MTALTSQAAAGAIAARSRIPIAQRRKARRLVVQATYQHLLSGSTPGAIEEEFREEHTGKVDWEYFTEILGGIVSQRAELDAHIEPLLDRKASALDPIEQAVL